MTTSSKGLDGGIFGLRSSVVWVLAFLLCGLASPGAAFAQGSFAPKVPSVSVSVTPLTTITRGTAGKVELQFRVGAGLHINSNTPSADYLIPTTLKLDAPTDIVVGRVTYPEGRMVSFPFSGNDRLSVYSGKFQLSVTIRPLSQVLPGKYAFHGRLHYQACDNARCYPPKDVPVSFLVKVVKGVTQHRRNPAQSPHIHG